LTYSEYKDENLDDDDVFSGNDTLVVSDIKRFPPASILGGSKSSVNTSYVREMLDETSEAINLLLRALNSCAMEGAVYNQEKWDLNAKTSAAALYNIQKVSLLRYSFKSALVQKGAGALIIKFMEIFSEPILRRKMTPASTLTDTRSKTSNGDENNSSSIEVLIECCVTIQTLCVNDNEHKSIMGSLGVCKVISSIVAHTDNILLLDHCFKLIIDLINSPIKGKNVKDIIKRSPHHGDSKVHISRDAKSSHSPAANQQASLYDNSQLLGEARICDYIKYVLQTRIITYESDHTTSTVRDNECSLECRQLFITLCDVIGSLSGSKINAIRFGEIGICLVLTAKMRSDTFKDNHLTEQSFELWTRWLLAVIRLCAENRAKNKLLFIAAGAAELIFNALNDFYTNFDIQMDFLLAQRYIEYSCWAIYNMIFFHNENLLYIARNISFSGPLLRDMLTLADINNNAKAKMDLVFMKLSSVWPVPLDRIDENDLEAQPKRGVSGQKGSRSRGGSSNKGNNRNNNQTKDGDDGSDSVGNIYSEDDASVNDNDWNQDEF